jgi:hypothetical protein
VTTVTPATVGGRFTNALPWTGQPVVSTQDGGRRRKGGWVGSGSATSPGSVADNGSSSGVTGTWTQMFCTQGRNELTWSSYLPTNLVPLTSLTVPSAPALSTNPSGGSIAAGTYFVVVTYTSAFGETAASASASQAISGTEELVITSPAAQAGATGWNAYVSTGSGAPYYLQQPLWSPTAIGTSLTLSATPAAAGQIPPAGPWYWFKADYATGTRDPHPGGSSYFAGSATFGAPLWPSNPSFPGYFSYQDNPFAGAASGPDGTSLRDPGNWIATIVQPPSEVNPNTGQYRVTDTTSVKTSVCNQYIFTPMNAGQAISGFNSIRSYRDKVNPNGTGYNYDASWDIYGWAHTAPQTYAISLEVMFWTYYTGLQYPWNIQTRTSAPYETGLEFGDGNVWDLYMTDDTAATGGVTNSYSYGIFALHDTTPNVTHDIGWIDILSPLQYFVKHYVVTSGGAPASPLSIPIWAIIEGWEMCSSNYAPAQFTHSDYRLEMS